MTATHVVWHHENQDHGTRNTRHDRASKSVHSLDRDPFNRLPRTARETVALHWDLAGFGDNLLSLSASQIAELWSGQADLAGPTVTDIVWPADDEVIDEAQTDSASLPTKPRYPKRLSPSKRRRKEARRQAELERLAAQQAAEKAARRRAQIAQRVAEQAAEARKEAEARRMDTDTSDDADWLTFGSCEAQANMDVVFPIPERRSCRGYGPDFDLSDDPFDKELLLAGMHITTRP